MQKETLKPIMLELLVAAGELLIDKKLLRQIASGHLWSRPLDGVYPNADQIRQLASHWTFLGKAGMPH